jgi:GMP synthase PP-ATPase subunit
MRPVSSEGAMTADWTRLPYDVLAKISTRITNEVPEVNRVTLGRDEQAARDDRMGMSAQPPAL